MRDFSDSEFRYYISARLVATWDQRNKFFGTFDCRTEYVKEDMFLDWSSGKVNGVKKALIRKGALKQKPQHRAGVTNLKIFLGKGKYIESCIQNAESNLQRTETDIQKNESLQKEIVKFRSGFLLKNKSHIREQIQHNE